MMITEKIYTAPNRMCCMACRRMPLLGLSW
jgi:hypothetical protein